MMAMLPPDRRAIEDPGELLDRIDALVLGGGADIDPEIQGVAAHPETVGSNPDRDRFEIALASVYISTEHASNEERLLGPTTAYVLAHRPCRVVVEVTAQAHRSPRATTLAQARSSHAPACGGHRPARRLPDRRRGSTR
jgi:Peptidase C26